MSSTEEALRPDGLQHHLSPASSARATLIEFILRDKSVFYGQDAFIKQIKSYEGSTLETILQNFPDGNDLTRFLKSIISRGDNEVRELLVYGETLRRSRVPFVVLKEVRQSLGLPDLSSATEGSKQREGIIAALKVAIASRTRWWMLDNAQGLAYRERLDHDQMSAPLAEFIMENSDSLDNIIAYVTSHEREPLSVDIEHLREYLNHAAPAMRDGLL